MRSPSGIALLTYSTQPRGGVVHAVAVAEALHDLGEDVVLYALDDGSGFARPPRCPCRLVPVPAAPPDVETLVLSRASAYVEALTDPSERRYAVYHAQDGISGTSLATLVEREIIPSFVRTVHHLDEFSNVRVAALQRRSVAAAEHLFTVSELWARRVRAEFGLAATVIGNGVDAQRFTPGSPHERSAARAACGIADHAPLFVAIGGIEARKNALGTLEAFALVHAARPEARLIFAGGASVFAHDAYRERFNARRETLGLAGAVDVLGVCDDARVVALLRAADAVVFASLAEGFGLVTLEALACGTPVVVSAIEPFRSIVPPRLAAFADPHDPRSIAGAMLLALEPSWTERVRCNGPAFAAAFTWPEVARRQLTYARYRAATRDAVHA